MGMSSGNRARGARARRLSSAILCTAIFNCPPAPIQHLGSRFDRDRGCQWPRPFRRAFCIGISDTEPALRSTTCRRQADPTATAFPTRRVQELCDRCHKSQCVSVVPFPPTRALHHSGIGACLRTSTRPRDRVRTHIRWGCAHELEAELAFDGCAAERDDLACVGRPRERERQDVLAHITTSVRHVFDVCRAAAGSLDYESLIRAHDRQASTLRRPAGVQWKSPTLAHPSRSRACAASVRFAPRGADGTPPRWRPPGEDIGKLAAKSCRQAVQLLGGTASRANTRRAWSATSVGLCIGAARSRSSRTSSVARARRTRPRAPGLSTQLAPTFRTRVRPEYRAPAAVGPAVRRRVCVRTLTRRVWGACYCRWRHACRRRRVARARRVGRRDDERNAAWCPDAVACSLG